MSGQPPKLQAPGKGLPFLQGFYARYVLYPRMMRGYDGAACIAAFRGETARVVEMAESIAEDKFFTPVLIDRVAGLEDSSRYWSAAMVLEHLLMTMRPMTQIAEKLAKGETINAHVSTADVKPKGGVATTKADWLLFFTNGAEECAARLEAVAARPDVARPSKKAATLRHPFFGPMPARGWIWVIGAHQAVHRNQMKRVVEGLK